MGIFRIGLVRVSLQIDEIPRLTLIHGFLHLLRLTVAVRFSRDATVCCVADRFHSDGIRKEGQSGPQLGLIVYLSNVSPK